MCYAEAATAELGWSFGQQPNLHFTKLLTIRDSQSRGESRVHGLEMYNRESLTYFVIIVNYS